MNYTWIFLISWLLVQFLVLLLVLAQLDRKEVIIPVSSPIKLECNDGLQMNNINVTIRRSNTTCLTTLEGCTLPIHAIETIKEACNKQLSCEVDMRNITNNHWCMHDYGYLNVWFTCKTIIRLSCDFEDDWCNWSSRYSHKGFYWNRDLWNPTVDHTTASTAGKYAYIYQDNPNRGEIATLESMYIIPTEQQCLSFWYFTTNDRDSVYVYQNEDMLFNLSDPGKEKWHHIQISLEKKSYSSYKLVFKVVRKSWWEGYKKAIVIDDILVENQNCNSLLFRCDFDTYLCYWNSQNSHHYEWVKQNGYLWRFNPGPRYDHSTASEVGYYMYLKREPDVLTDEGTNVYLELPNVDMIILVNSCFTFWYYMNGNQIGGLNVTLDDDFAWTKFGVQDDKWKKGMIDLHKRNLTNIKFIGIVGNGWIGDIAIDDLYITEGTCKGLFDHEELCVHLEEGIPKETFCPRGYLDFTNPRLSFDPEKEECSETYNQTKIRILQECRYRNDSQKCLIDLSTDISSHPECFQVYEFRILHTCEAVETTTVSSFSTSKEGSSEGLVVGLVIGGLLLACAVMFIVVIIRRHTFKSRPREKMKNNLGGNDYIGHQDIALQQTANRSSHIQYVDKQTSIDDEYAIVDPTAETSFNEIIDDGNRTADSYMILDPNDTGFNRTTFSNTPTGYEFAKPVRDTRNKFGVDDQYDISDEGVYDHLGINRHKELENNIYNHAVDTIYDSGSHKRKNEWGDDTYDRFTGLKTEDDYDISTTT